MATPTTSNETGRPAKPAELAGVPPERERWDEPFASFLDGAGLDGSLLADLLSDMITHEQCGADHYRSLARGTHDPALKRKYEQFGDETKHHVEILEHLARSLDGETTYVSPSARAAEHAGTGLLESTFMLGGSVGVVTQEMVMLDAVLLAEAKGQPNWSRTA